MKRRKWILGGIVVLLVLAVLMGGCGKGSPSANSYCSEQRAFSASEDMTISYGEQGLEIHKKGIGIGRYCTIFISVFLDYEDFPFVENTGTLSCMFPMQTKDGVELENGFYPEKYATCQPYALQEAKLIVFSSHGTASLNEEDIEFLTGNELLDNADNLYLIISQRSGLYTYRFGGKLVQVDPRWYEHMGEEPMKNSFFVDFGGVSHMEPDRIAGAPVFIKEGDRYKLVGLAGYKTEFNATAVIPIKVVFDKLGIKIEEGLVNLEE